MFKYVVIFVIIFLLFFSMPALWIGLAYTELSQCFNQIHDKNQFLTSELQSGTITDLQFNERYTQMQVDIKACKLDISKKYSLPADIIERLSRPISTGGNFF